MEMVSFWAKASKKWPCISSTELTA